MCTDVQAETGVNRASVEGVWLAAGGFRPVWGPCPPVAPARGPPAGRCLAGDGREGGLQAPHSRPEDAEGGAAEAAVSSSSLGGDVKDAAANGGAGWGCASLPRAGLRAQRAGRTGHEPRGEHGGRRAAELSLWSHPACLSGGQLALAAKPQTALPGELPS